MIDLQSESKQLDYFSAVFRASLDESERQFSFKDLKKESMLLKEEKIENSYEYEQDKLIVSLYPNDILITHKWQKVSLIKNMNPGNI